jgi:hypothetical protein
LSSVHDFRPHAPPVHAKFAGQSASFAHVLGTQWWLVAHVAPTPQEASLVQPATQIFWPMHAHAAGRQIEVGLCAVQSASPLQVMGGLWQVPHPAKPPGGTHSMKLTGLQSLIARQSPAGSAPPVPPLLLDVLPLDVLPLDVLEALLFVPPPAPVDVVPVPDPVTLPDPHPSVIIAPIATNEP